VSEDREPLPDGWAWTTIGEVTQPSVEQRAPEEDRDFTYVEISSIDNVSKRIVSPTILPGRQAPSRARQRLKAGDVLVSMTRPNLNAVAMVPPSLDQAFCSTGFDVLRPIKITSE
jgi:type I restriction enzyme, S subunit